jgi:NAD+ diphosphatase
VPTPVLVPAPYQLGWSPTQHAATLDRAAHLRAAADAVQAAWTDSRAQVVLVHAGRSLVTEQGLRRLTPAQAPAGERYLLGCRPDGAPVFAVRTAEPLPGDDVRDLRQAAGVLRGDDLEQMMHAVALATWHETHPRCSRCGEPTEVVQAGYARRCPAEGSEHYPRTDPAVIVLVLDGAEPGHDRCLLGRQASWPQGRFSTLAGFVEPGETVEQTLAREVAEEVGVTLDTVAYAGSQPWPFPASLMLAAYATAVAEHRGDDALRPDGAEIVEARWFDRAGLAAALQSGEVLVPPALSVARRLIEGWYGGRLRGREAWR